MEPARDPIERLLSSWVNRTGTWMQQVDRVSRSPSATSYTDDERGALGFNSSVSVSLRVAEGACQACTEAGAMFAASLLLQAVAVGERETDLASPPFVVMRPLVRVGKHHQAFNGFRCRRGHFSCAASLPS